MKKILFILAICLFFGLTGCNDTDDLPPKEGLVTSRYILPKGKVLTETDREIIKERKEEYNKIVFNRKIKYHEKYMDIFIDSTNIRDALLS